MACSGIVVVPAKELLAHGRGARNIYSALMAEEAVAVKRILCRVLACHSCVATGCGAYRIRAANVLDEGVPCLDFAD